MPNRRVRVPLRIEYRRGGRLREGCTICRTIAAGGCLTTQRLPVLGARPKPDQAGHTGTWPESHCFSLYHAYNIHDTLQYLTRCIIRNVC